MNIMCTNCEFRSSPNPPLVEKVAGELLLEVVGVLEVLEAWEGQTALGTLVRRSFPSGRDQQRGLFHLQEGLEVNGSFCQPKSQFR